jgi:cbb3-type cytochrome oxidase maturation protein
MTVLYLVLPLAVIFSAIAVAAFLWALRRGQFDDLKTPAVRAIYDDRRFVRIVRAPSRRIHRR